MQPYAEVAGEWDEVNVRLRAYYDIGLDRLRVVRDNAPANGPPSWASRWYLFDGLGSTRALVDDSGIVQDGYRYDAFGTPTTLAGGSGFANAFLFNGQVWDDAVGGGAGGGFSEGLYFLRARYYAAGAGRFLSQDPLLGEGANPASLHRYNYTDNNPVDHIDPSGECFSLSDTMMATAKSHALAMISGGISNVLYDYGLSSLFQTNYSIYDALVSFGLGAVTEGTVIGIGGALKVGAKVFQKIQGSKLYVHFTGGVFDAEKVVDGSRRWATVFPEIKGMWSWVVGGNKNISGLKFPLKGESWKRFMSWIAYTVKQGETVEVVGDALREYMPAFAPNFWSWYKGFLGQQYAQAWKNPWAFRGLNDAGLGWQSLWEGAASVGSIRVFLHYFRGLETPFIDASEPKSLGNPETGDDTGEDY
jgi:RHS repeat-associated protein